MNTYLAGSAVVRYRAVKRGADENTVVPATANAESIGIAVEVEIAPRGRLG